MQETGAEAVKLEGGDEVDRRACARARPGRDPGHGPHRADAAVGPRARRVPGAGPGRGRGRTAAAPRRCASTEAGCFSIVLELHARAARRRDQPRRRGPHHRDRRRRRRATARSSSSTTCSASTKASSRASCAASPNWPGRARGDRRLRQGRPRRRVPGPGAFVRVRTVHTTAGIRAAVAELRAGAARSRQAPQPRRSRTAPAIVALVPTMGYLHEGHLSLVDRARERADHVVMSIFVNPLQFGPGEDLDRYPRDLERDAELAAGPRRRPALRARRGDDVPGRRARRPVVPRRLADRLCGAYRPGHFEGVSPSSPNFQHRTSDVAVFGQKDYQQAVLIRRMVEDLDLGIEIDVAPIVREEDGLAISSRNVYLDAADRARALALPRALREAADAFGEGERDAGCLAGACGRCWSPSRASTSSTSSWCTRPRSSRCMRPSRGASSPWRSSWARRD